MNYYDRDIISNEENKTIGILLCLDKKKKIVEYTLPSDNEQLFASKYELYLPKREELEEEVRRVLDEF